MAVLSIPQLRRLGKVVRQCAPGKFVETPETICHTIKKIDVIRILHDGFQCSLEVSNGQTDWFPVTSGLKQGCMLSPLFFRVANGSVIRETPETKTER